MTPPFASAALLEALNLTGAVLAGTTTKAATDWPEHAQDYAPPLYDEDYLPPDSLHDDGLNPRERRRWLAGESVWTGGGISGSEEPDTNRRED